MILPDIQAQSKKKAGLAQFIQHKPGLF